MKTLLCTSLFLTQTMIHAGSLETSLMDNAENCSHCPIHHSLNGKKGGVSMVQVKGYDDGSTTQSLGTSGNSSSNSLSSSQDLELQFSGEFLYLRAIEEGLDYALLSPVQKGSENTFLAGGAWGSVSRIQPGFHAGYRVGASYAPSNGKLQASVQWMHYKLTSLSSVNVPSPAISPVQPTDIIWPNWALQWGVPNAQEALASWNLKMDVVDATMGAQFSPGKVVSVRPFAGFRGASIRQTLAANYLQVYMNTGASTDNGETVYNPTYTAMSPTAHWKNQGYGIVGGVDTQLMLGQGFSFFCQGTGSLLMGRIHPLFTQDTVGLPTDGVLPPAQQNMHVTNAQFVTTPVFEAIAGIGYQHDWKKVGVDLKLGWEEQFWGNQNFMPRFLSQSGSGYSFNDSGSLSLGGYSIKATLKF
ncbi:Lpg1974 family pore-forming outer membrane protein [Rhabdochlamydiaceae symbiont of Dictyostelium giganteum]|uniref:Lpg1974 family pore-forming outer membrane protein n=1 Tax=Rhabdochlamydiaceae symbiont of Dictyostelium giganteum TaxID=3342349 RepID=UPI00384AD42C